MNDYEAYLSELLPEKDSLTLVKAEAARFEKAHSAEECYSMALKLYDSANFQIQEVGVLLLGSAAHQVPEALAFLKQSVSCHESWKVQEVLAMAFDRHCRSIGYENALPLIREWLQSDRANARRAVSEGLRVWTSRPYFDEHPEAAIALLAEHRSDESEYVRKSIGNALKDISKKHAALITAELATWALTDKRVQQVHRLASKHLPKSEPV